MPIGAAIGGAVIGAGGSVLAGAESSHAQTQAAQTAADSSLQIANENNQLFRDTRNQNIAIAQPFYNNGVAAGNALQGLLLGSPTAPTAATAPTSTTAQTGALAGYQTAPVAGTPVPVGNSALSPYNRYGGSRLINDWSEGDTGYINPQATASNSTPTPPSTQTPTSTPATGSAGTVTSALNPWDQFRNSTNYQFRYDQGLKATEGNYATKGALDSGAAEKAKITFGQNFASNELSNYMNLLAGQQNVGLSAGNAIMGVSTNAANNIAGQNTNAGNVAANAALQSGQASANMWGTVGQTAGQLGGALFQYGMGQFKPATTLPAAGGGYNVNSGTSNYFNSNPFGGGF